MIPQTRRISYRYDGLNRLTGATETPGTTYDYTYDLAGNRTEVRENGALVANLSYNDANQVIGWSYDAAGNLLNDGTTTRSYDALNRLVAHDSTSYTYNGDGVLVSDGTTTSAQDLAAPLSQVLSDGAATYVYGHARLRALGGPWYVGDALGSVRQTLDDAGGVRATTNYDPWGTPQGTLSAPFGFTGELHHQGQVYLRARWYAPGQGRFVSEDPFAGFPELPYSLHAYQYGYSNPVRWTDPTGECVGWLWGDPTCQFIGRDRILRGDLEWEEARPWAGAGLDVAPVTGDIKGFLEVFTGCDLVTGDDLGAWRWAGLVPLVGPRLRAVRMVRHLHDVDVVVDLGRHGDDLVLPPGARASGGRGSGGTRSSDIPWSTPTVRRAARELGEGATNVWVASRTEAEELFLRTFVGENPPYRNSTGMTSTEANRFFDGRARTYHWDDQVDAEGRLLGHPQNDPNAQYRHLQVHTDREVIVISYGPPLVWP